jgi:Fe-S cluster biogenesis protein NfuA
VRTSLLAALESPLAWRPAPGATTLTADTVLRAVAEQVVDGPAGRFVRSHGGGIEVVTVRDGVVEVRLTGACEGCPAVGLTLRSHVEAGLRERCPWLRDVRLARRTVADNRRSLRRVGAGRGHKQAFGQASATSGPTPS